MWSALCDGGGITEQNAKNKRYTSILCLKKKAKPNIRSLKGMKRKIFKVLSQASK
jgi:hypothetical protein